VLLLFEKVEAYHTESTAVENKIRTSRRLGRYNRDKSGR
jgi:hypothetical protein